MPANNIYIQIDVNSQSAQQNVNALNQQIANTGPTAAKSSQQATTGLNSIGVSIQSVNREFASLSNAIAGLGIAKAIGGMVQLAAEMSRAERAQAAFAGSAEKANEIFEQVRAIAQKTPFKFDDLEEAAQRMLALGFAAKDVPYALKTVADQVTRMGGEVHDVNVIISLFGRMMQKDFVAAMDLLRALPAQGVPVIKALGAALEKEKNRAFDAAQVKEAIKEGILDPMQTVRIMLDAMAQKGSAEDFSNDAARAFKNLGDTIRETTAKLFGPEGFGPALSKLADHITNILAPLGGLVSYLMKLQPETKEMIVNWTAAAAAFALFGTSLKIVTSLSGPLLSLVGSMWKFTAALVAMNPELAAAVVFLGALSFGAYKLIPQFKELVDSVAGGALDKLKASLHGLAEEGKKFFAEMLKPAAPMDAGSLLRTDDLFKTIKEEEQKHADAAQQTLLTALASPVEAVRMKYATLFRELEEKIKNLKEDQQTALRGILSGAETAETAAAESKETRKRLDEIARYQVERAKASADIQVAYIEAQDAQDLRNKVRAYDRITQIRVDSAQQVAQIEKQNLQDEFDRFAAMAQEYRVQFAQAGVDVDAMIDKHREELRTKQKMADQKQVDEAQKYRLEGWKKANDAIIEEQRRVYDAFKDQFSQLFDVFTDKTKSLSQALGDFAKKLFMGEARELFSNTLAGSATQSAGYGEVPESVKRGGQGILGILLRRGMPPRPPLPPPATEQFGVGVSGIKGYDMQAAQGTANRMDITANTYDDATVRFAAAVERFSDAATVQSKGSADRSADTGDAFQAASSATGVAVPLLRAVAKVESSMNPLALGPQTRYGRAMGLMQLMPGTAAARGVTRPFDPEQNVMAGAQELQWLLKRYNGDQSAALAAYNFGAGNYDRRIASGRPLPLETQQYVQRITRILAASAPDAAPATVAAAAPAASVAQLANLPMAGPGVPAGLMLPGFGGGMPLGGEAYTGPTVAQLASLPQGRGVLQQLAPLLLAGGLKPGSKMPTATELGRIIGVMKGHTSVTSMATSPLVGMAATLGGMALASKGLQQHYAPAAVAGGGLAGLGYAMTNPALISRVGLGAGLGAGAAAGAGLGLFAAGFQRGGGAGLAMDIGGGALAGAGIGTMIMPGVGTLIGAAIGAGVGAITGIVRLFVHTEQERIRTGIKQVYGIDLTNRQILNQIQQIVDQKYGGNVDIGIRSQDVQDIVRLYALSTGQAARLPRPMYAATIEQSAAGGLATQPVYQGGVKVQNPYTGPTTYQYSTAVTNAQNLSASGGNSSSVFLQLNPQQANDLFTGRVVQAVQQNPAAVASANSRATRMGDSRVSQASNMLEPLTSLS